MRFKRFPLVFLALGLIAESTQAASGVISLESRGSAVIESTVRAFEKLGYTPCTPYKLPQEHYSKGQTGKRLHCTKGAAIAATFNTLKSGKSALSQIGLRSEIMFGGTFIPRSVMDAVFQEVITSAAHSLR